MEGCSSNLGFNMYPGDSEARGPWAARGDPAMAMNLEWNMLTDPVFGADKGICVRTNPSEAQTGLNFQSCPLES